MPSKCRRCGCALPRYEAHITWLNDNGKDGPTLCADCYEYIVDNYEEEMSEEELEELLDDCE